MPIHQPWARPWDKLPQAVMNLLDINSMYAYWSDSDNGIPGWRVQPARRPGLKGVFVAKRRHSMSGSQPCAKLNNGGRNMPQEYLDAAVAAGKVSLLPQEVKNLIALHSLQAAWRRLDQYDRGVGGMGFRLYSVKDDMATTNRFVNVVSDDDPGRFDGYHELNTWQDAVYRWERLYGPRL